MAHQEDIVSKEKNFFLGNKKLSSFSTRGEDFCDFDRIELDEKTRKLGTELADLQEVIFAESKHKILIVLQGLDTSGKDGTVKHVFGATNPQGVRMVSFKQPTELEQSYDYMWRIHKEVPRSGEMVIFNRSHYEDFVVPLVHKTHPKDEVMARLEDICAFERMLVREGVVLFKFFLHISRQEQTQRLKERLDNDEKHWKFSLSDLTERKYWDEYHKAYDKVIRATHTKNTPWDVIPADQKFIRNYIISKILVERLKKLNAQFPKFDPKIIKKIKAEAERILPRDEKGRKYLKP